MKHMKAIGIAVCALGMLAGAAWAKEDIPNEWYGAGGAIDDYALVSREDEPGFKYTPSPEQWRDRNIYQLFTDRFATDGNIRVKSYKPAWDCEYTGDGLNRQFPFNRNYHHGGSWKGLQYQIPYLQGMGVTAVWISGVQQNDQSATDNRWTPYHQYHVDNFFRCDPAMGTFQDLKDLIDALHAAGIAVILDVAPNHMCDKNGRWDKETDKQFSWTEDGRRWWNDNNKHCAPFDNLDRFHVNGTINHWDDDPENKIGQFKGTDDLKQEDDLTSQYLYMAFKNLIDATDCDGFRVDAIKHIPYNWCRDWAQAMRDHAAERGKKNFLMFGELFSYDHGALASWCSDGYGFNSALLFPLMQAMNNAFGNGYSPYQLGEEMNRVQQYGAGKENAIAFLDNHDVNRFALSYAPNNAANAKRIMAPAMTFLYLAPPVPLLYYGTEHMFDQGGHGNGSNRSWDDSNSDDGDWQRECMFDRGFQPGNAGGDMFQDWAKDRGLYYHIAWLNNLRNHCRALRRGGFQQRQAAGGQGLYAFTKWYGEQVALVLINTADGDCYVRDYNSGWLEVGIGGKEFKENGDGASIGSSSQDGWLDLSSVVIEGKGTKIFICGYDPDNDIKDVFPNGGGSSSGVWISGTYGYPTENATTDDTIYINTEAGPTNQIAQIEVIYYLNPTIGGDWPASETGTRTNMTVIPDWNSQAGAWYHAEIKGISGSGTLHYAICATTTNGEAVWDSNNNRNYQLTISEPPVSIGAKFQSVSANPVEPDEGGSVTITAAMQADDGADVSALSVTMDYAFVTKTIATVTTSDWTHVTMTKGTSVSNTVNFSTAISDLPGGTTLIYKLEATNGGTDKIQANGGNAYETKISGTIAGFTGVCWHCPTNCEPHTNVTMRTPAAPHVGWDLWLRVGNYQGEGTGGGTEDEPMDMNGGTIYYRYGAGTNWPSAWENIPLGYETRDGHNNFWSNAVHIAEGKGGLTLQYFFEVRYSDRTPGLNTTYIYMHPDNSAMYMLTTDRKEAEGTPFEVGIVDSTDAREPGFIWHGGNITRSANNQVQIWAKIGYLGDDGVAWADDAVIRYRIDLKKEGTARSAGVKAIKAKKTRAARSWKALTSEAPMTMKSTVEDGGGHGKAMMWMGTITDDRLLDDDAVLIYEIYARRKSNDEGTAGNGNWRQAEYNAGDGSCTFEYRMWSDGSGDLLVNGVPADYTTSKFFVNEADSNDTVTVEVEYHAPNDAEAVELFTNFGRRDYADRDWNDDGWPDGMIPPARDSVLTNNCADGYWQAIHMTKSQGAYTAELTTGKCGVYRITARYMPKGSTNWVYYADNPNGTDRRDHVVVISPKKAMEQTMYELNVLTTKAAGASNTESGNFEELSERLTAGKDDPYGEFSIDYLNRMGINCLWFQPIHPNLDYERGNTDPDTGARYYPGSPYATRNYFSVNYEMTKTKNTEGLSVDQKEANAVAAFTNFVGLCDYAHTGTAVEEGVTNLATINVMLDGVMNHTSFDAVFGEGWAYATNGLLPKAIAEIDGISPEVSNSWRSITAADKIPATALGIQWYSHVVVTNAEGKVLVDQSQPATHYNPTNYYDNDIANAPERFDFGKWNDVAELLYGNYSTMVRYDDRKEVWKQNESGDWYSTNEGEEANRIYSEEDKYYYDQMLPATKLLWKYMAAYPEYWIRKTGHDFDNDAHALGSKVAGTDTAWDDLGIDGLRCDYAQGLPNQFWEYCINRTRKLKWNFLFMAESLDGGKVGFRSNRQFDILNENMVFRFTQDHVSDPWQLQHELETRRDAYGNGLILLNLTCHDEVMPWGDPQVTASRYAMVSAFDGVPMIFYGQEQAISKFEYGTGSDTNPASADKWKGFLKFESNFGKWIPHFKSWNKMHVWTNPAWEAGTANDSRAMAEFYGRINLARQKSPALQSQNRWFLNTDKDGNYIKKIMFCAKWEKDGVPVKNQDSVFAAVLFVNDEWGENNELNMHWGEGAWYDISPFAAKMGIENRADKFYNVVNLASTDTNFLWATPRSGAQLYTDGLDVLLEGTWKWNAQLERQEDRPATEWTDKGYVAQYLKVYEVSGEIDPGTISGLIINDPSDTITVAATDTEYEVVGMAGADITGDVISWTNSATGESGTFAKTDEWAKKIPLGFGENIITVSAQSSGKTYTDYASVSAGGNVPGFGPITNATHEVTNENFWAGWFVGTKAATIGIQGFTADTAYGLYANGPYIDNSKANAEIGRKILYGKDLTSISVDLGINWDSQATNSYRGFEFYSADRTAIFGVNQKGSPEGDGDPTIRWYANGVNQTGTWCMAYGFQVFRVTLTRTKDGYEVSGTDRNGTNIVAFSIADTNDIAGWKSYMNCTLVNNERPEGYPEGVTYTDMRQFYFDRVSYTVPPNGEDGTATDTVRILKEATAPTLTVTDVPAGAQQLATTVRFNVKANGDGSPTVSVVAMVDGKAYTGYTYSSGSGDLVFKPDTVGTYEFVFRAKNTTVDGLASDTETVTVTVEDNAPTISVNSVGPISIGADGKVSVPVTTDKSSLSSVPVWVSEGFDAAYGDWRWYQYGTADINADGEVTLDFDITADTLMISIGKPSYLK